MRLRLRVERAGHRERTKVQLGQRDLQLAHGGSRVAALQVLLAAIDLTEHAIASEPGPARAGYAGAVFLLRLGLAVLANGRGDRSRDGEHLRDERVTALGVQHAQERVALVRMRRE